MTRKRVVLNAETLGTPDPPYLPELVQEPPQVPVPRSVSRHVGRHARTTELLWATQPVTRGAHIGFYDGHTVDTLCGLVFIPTETRRTAPMVDDAPGHQTRVCWTCEVSSHECSHCRETGYADLPSEIVCSYCNGLGRLVRNG